MKKVLLTISIGIILLLVLGVIYVTIIYPNSVRRDHLTTGIEVLQHVSSEEQRDRIAQGHGMTATYPDGSWIVVYYKDSHILGLPSIAVARDSEDQWYKSEDHYCALFVVAMQNHSNRLMEDEMIQKGQMSEDERMPQSSEGDTFLATSVLGAADLGTARGFLKSLGFEEFSPVNE